MNVYKIKRFSLREKLFFLNSATGEAISGESVRNRLNNIKDHNKTIDNLYFDPSPGMKEKETLGRALELEQKDQAIHSTKEDFKRKVEREIRKSDKEFQGLPGKSRKAYLNKSYNMDYKVERALEGNELKDKLNKVLDKIPGKRLKRKLNPPPVVPSKTKGNFILKGIKKLIRR